ncbi:MAG: hypothetical protein K2K97_06840 [Muribaculaceae bacterium]|nr:hypothetical protein [Muribaculaceae bacterium]
MTNNKILRYSAILLSFIAGIYILFSNLYYCEFGGDENYMALCVRDYKYSPLAVLTYYIGHIWCDIFGFSLLNLRILTRVLYIIAVGGGCWYMMRHIKSTAIRCLTILTSFFIAGLSGFAIYDWNSASSPFILFFVLPLLWYVNKPSLLKISTVGFFCALLTLSKATMGTTAFVALAAIIFARKYQYADIFSNQKQTRALSMAIIYDCIAGVIAMSASILLILLLICGSPEGIKELLSPDNIITGHGLDSISIFIWRFKVCVPLVIISWFAGLICYWLAEKTYSYSICSFTNITAVCAAIFAGWSALRIYAMIDDYSTPIFGLGLPYLVILCVAYPFFILKKKHKENNHSNSADTLKLLQLKSLLILGVVFLMGFGSDTMPERWLVCSVFPIVVTLVYPWLDSTYISVIKRWLIISAIMFTVILFYRNHGLRSEFSYVDKEFATRGPIPVPQDFEPFLTEIDPIVESLQRQNKNFTFWGAHHLAFQLAYNVEPTISIHAFHIFYQNFLDFVKDPDNLEYMFITFPKDDTTLVDRSIRAAEKAGFRRVGAGDYYILYENPNYHSKKDDK